MRSRAGVCTYGRTGFAGALERARERQAQIPAVVTRIAFLRRSDCRTASITCRKAGSVAYVDQRTRSAVVFKAGCDSPVHHCFIMVFALFYSQICN